MEKLRSCNIGVKGMNIELYLIAVSLTLISHAAWFNFVHKPWYDSLSLEERSSIEEDSRF
jgi:hypothetical protein